MRDRKRLSSLSRCVHPQKMPTLRPTESCCVTRCASSRPGDVDVLSGAGFADATEKPQGYNLIQPCPDGDRASTVYVESVRAGHVGEKSGSDIDLLVPGPSKLPQGRRGRQAVAAFARSLRTRRLAPHRRRARRGVRRSAFVHAERNGERTSGLDRA